MKRVAVVGAGPSGLAALKELLAEGCEAVCFERAEGPGGVFRFDEAAGVVWETCRLTSSGVVTAFSDFPVEAVRAGHMRVGDYVDYLQQYCAAFGLTPHIRYGATVEAATRVGDFWSVRSRDGSGVREERFDAVAVCSGLHQHKHMPAIPGAEGFEGEIIHGADYRRAAQIAGKRVLVVGAGESGADVAAEVANHAAETVLSLRRGVAVLPREMFGKPKDFQTSRLINSPAHWIFQTRNPADDDKRQAYRLAFLPFLFVDKALQTIFVFFWEYLPLFKGASRADIRTNLRARKLATEFLAVSGGTVNEQFGTKTDDFLRRIAEGKCRRAAGLARFEGARAIFDDGTDFRPEVVIYCTGFETRAPFLDQAIVDAPRYFNMINPAIGRSLAFIGFLRPAFGAIPPLAELQARWFALLQSGKKRLPDDAAMQRSIGHWREYRAHFFRAVKGRLDHLVEFTPFMDALAAEIGAKPTLGDVRRESARFQKRFFEGPFVAAQYRLVGPHAKPELARRIIENLPLTHPWPDRLNLHLRWALSRALHRLKGSAYAPKLELEP